MSSPSYTIPVSSELGTKAQAVLDDMGLDVTAAVKIFLEQLTNKEPICFEIVKPTRAAVRPPFEYNSLAGQVRMSDDFDAPLKDFEEYM